MKVLMISGDPGVLDLGSETGKRMEEYRKALGELDILVCRGNIFSFALGFLRGMKMMRRTHYDIITAQDIEHSFLAWMLAKIFGIKWQMQIHTDIFSPYFVKNRAFNKTRVWLAKFLLPRADCVRAVSERIKKSIDTWRLSRQVAAQPPIIVLPIFVDTEKIKNSPIETDLHEKYGKDKFIILMASRITKEKNIGLAINVLRNRLIRTNKPVFLLIVGNGPELPALRRKAYGLGLENNVVFEPYTNDLASYYKTCDLFLLTSNYEGYGRTLIEAASAGAKIISSDVGIAQEILEPENIFKAGDADDLKSKLENAISGEIKQARLPKLPTKAEYLKLFAESFEKCLPAG